MVGSALGCAGPAAETVGPAVTAPAHTGTWERFAEDGRIGRYTSSSWTFSTVSYWIEGDDGVVVIDTQFVESEARELIEVAEAATGKPVVAAIVLHANPDKFNGTKVFQDHGAKVLTSAQVLALIPEVHKKRVAAFYDRYKPDYPLTEPVPESFGDAATELELAGVPVKLHVVGAGCSAAHVVAQVGPHLFAGDLVANGTHSWLELGLTDAWLERVAELEAMGARFVHPGRGASGGVELLTAQREYLEAVAAAVAAEHPALPVDPAGLKRVTEHLVARYPDHRFAVFLKIGLPAEWRRQASQPPVGGP